MVTTIIAIIVGIVAFKAGGLATGLGIAKRAKKNLTLIEQKEFSKILEKLLKKS